jgi:hypothetical protein
MRRAASTGWLELLDFARALAWRARGGIGGLQVIDPTSIG